MADKIREVAVEEADRIKTLASDAARSGAYLYPIRVSVFLRQISRLLTWPLENIVSSVADRFTNRVLPTSSLIARYGNL